MEYSTLDEYSKIRKRKVRNAIIIFIIVIILAAVCFSGFKISYGGHFALREAKNIKLALQTLDVEYYGVKKSVYNPYKENGLEDGVKKRLSEAVTSEDFKVQIIKYDIKAREVKEFEYESGVYRVTYRCDDNIEKWKIDFCVTIQQYSNDTKE